MKKMKELTNQEGVNWFINQNRLLKPKFKKNFFSMDRITNFDKPILNQSPFTQKLFLKFFLSKRYFL